MAKEISKEQSLYRLIYRPLSLVRRWHYEALEEEDEWKPTRLALSCMQPHHMWDDWEEL